MLPFQSNAGDIAGSGLNNQARMLERTGDLAGAEQKHLEALRVKIAASGENSIHVALTKNALGELYLKTGELDKALEMFEAADIIRTRRLPLSHMRHQSEMEPLQ